LACGSTWLALVAQAWAQPAADGGERVACVLHAHDGIEAHDAKTAAALVCEALRNTGSHVEREPVADRAGRTAYEISLRPLGTLVVLQVALLSASGETLRNESLQLQALEEIPVAARRIAEALYRSKSIASTAQVDTLVGEDTRSYEKRSGETFFALGVFGYGVPSRTGTLGVGVLGRAHFETPRFGVGAELRLGGGNTGQQTAFLAGLAVGGRLFLLEQNLSPFLGAGLGILSVRGHTANGEYQRGSGLAPFLEVGFEALRFYRSRFDVFARVDLPAYALESSLGNRAYAPPISIVASYSFD
jgi:hypothetical protein